MRTDGFTDHVMDFLVCNVPGAKAKSIALLKKGDSQKKRQKSCSAGLLSVGPNWVMPVDLERQLKNHPLLSSAP